MLKNVLEMVAKERRHRAALRLSSMVICGVHYRGVLTRSVVHV